MAEEKLKGEDGKTCFAPAANGMQIAFYALTQGLFATQMVDDGTQKWRRQRQQQQQQQRQQQQQSLLKLRRCTRLQAIKMRSRCRCRPHKYA